MKVSNENDEAEEEGEKDLWYERVGYISTIFRYEAGFTRWMGTWERRNVMII
jgi:hypothetical protein